MKNLASTRNIRNRLSRNIGHLVKVREMLDNGEPFENIMMQLSAVRKSIAGTSNALVAYKAQEELITAMEFEEPERIMEFYKDYSKYF